MNHQKWQLRKSLLNCDSWWFSRELIEWSMSQSWEGRWGEWRKLTGCEESGGCEQAGGCGESGACEESGGCGAELDVVNSEDARSWADAEDWAVRLRDIRFFIAIVTTGNARICYHNIIIFVHPDDATELRLLRLKPTAFRSSGLQTICWNFFNNRELIKAKRLFTLLYESF
jgi:hypothetical protein